MIYKPPMTQGELELFLSQMCKCPKCGIRAPLRQFDTQPDSVAICHVCKTPVEKDP